MALAHQHAVAEQLGEQLDVRCFTTARAGAGELKQRFQKLGILDSSGVDAGAVDVRAS